MRWVRDLSGRLPKRPHYEAEELDRACEDLIRELQGLRSTVFPITTDDLTVLIEQRAADLDLYADLSDEGASVEAVTDFVPGERPRVRINYKLAEDPRRAHRLRTTLAHELAHVVFHNFIWWFDQGALDAAAAAALSPRCHRRQPTRMSDWMEWQANYAAGALLIPIGALAQPAGPHAAAWAQSAAGRERVRRVQRTFDVSAQAASVRLFQLGYLTQRPTTILRSPIPR